MISRITLTLVLISTSITVSGGERAASSLSVFGSPWQPEFCDWAFNLPRGRACRDKWSCIPAGTDLLVTHGPPLGRGDECLPARHRAGMAGADKSMTVSTFADKSMQVLLHR